MIRSRAPLRVSFSGGGTDIKNYFVKYGGVVISSTIGRYAYTTLKPRKDGSINIREEDFDIDFSFHTNDVSNNNDVPFFNAIVKHFKPEEGFDLITHSDTDYGSGLGSSSAMMVSVVGAFNKWLNLQLNEYDVAETAYKIEREDLKISGGMQDQYSASFGGFNFIEFRNNKVVVNSMKLKRSTIYDLQFRLMMVNLGISRFSGNLIDTQIKHLSDEEVLEHYEKMKDLTVEIKDVLYRGQLDDMGHLLTEEWNHKRMLSPNISNQDIDHFFRFASENGAQGYKLLGAGGSGHALILTDEERKYTLAKSLEKAGYSSSNIEFVPTGLEAWNNNGS